jgi:hypothetical protein
MPKADSRSLLMQPNPLGPLSCLSQCAGEPGRQVLQSKPILTSSRDRNTLPEKLDRDIDSSREDFNQGQIPHRRGLAKGIIQSLGRLSGCNRSASSIIKPLQMDQTSGSV